LRELILRQAKQRRKYADASAPVLIETASFVVRRHFNRRTQRDRLPNEKGFENKLPQGKRLLKIMTSVNSGSHIWVIGDRMGHMGFLLKPCPRLRGLSRPLTQTALLKTFAE